MRRFGPLSALQLEGLNDDALEMVLAAAAEPAGKCLESLSLQRGLFSGTCAYTSAAQLPAWEDAPAVLLPRLLELEFGGCGFLTDAGLEALTAAAPALIRLRLTVNAFLHRPRLACPELKYCTLAICANLADDAVNDLCQGSPKLVDLSLWRCSSLQTPRLHGTRLVSVNLCECTSLLDGALHQLTSSCPQLATLLLAGCESLSGAPPSPSWPPFGMPLPGTSAALVPGATWAEANPGGSANVSGGGGGHGNMGLTLPPPPAPSNTPARPSCLTSLDLSDIHTMNDALLGAACTSAPQLRHLDFSRSGPAVCAPVVGGPCLLTLVSTRCESLADEAINWACDASPQLSTIMLALCGALQFPRIQGARLTDINLSGCAQLQDGAVTHACAHCPRLTRLSLSLCSALIEPIVRGAALRRVEMSHCERLSRPAISGVLIEQLALSGCAALEDEPLEAACRGCPKLAKLSIDGCGRLVGARLSSASLKTLSCQNVPSAVVEAAADRARLPALQRILSEDQNAIEEVD